MEPTHVTSGILGWGLGAVLFHALVQKQMHKQVLGRDVRKRGTDNEYYTFMFAYKSKSHKVILH